MEFIAPIDSCPDANELVAYLQASSEVCRAGLSRQLHDELGGLLVAATMDLAFAERSLAADDRLRERLARARAALATAIELKRKTIEDLRPSILDNFGLFEALKWETKAESARTHLSCSESYPDPEPQFTREAAIALFRIVQESLRVALRQPSVKAAQIKVDIESDTLRIRVSHDGEASREALDSRNLFEICSIAHRAHSFGGHMTITGIAGGGAEYAAALPLSHLTTAQPIPGG